MLLMLLWIVTLGAELWGYKCLEPTCALKKARSCRKSTETSKLAVLTTGANGLMPEIKAIRRLFTAGKAWGLTEVFQSTIGTVDANADAMSSS